MSVIKMKCCLSYSVKLGISEYRLETIEKLLEMPYQNLLCLPRICLFVYVYNVTKDKVTKPYAKKFDELLVNDDKIVN